MSCISQKELKQVLIDSATLKKLRADERRLNLSVQEKTEEIISKLKNGANIKAGKLTASYQETDVKKRITEGLIESILGKEYLTQLKQNAGETKKDILEITTALPGV